LLYGRFDCDEECVDGDESSDESVVMIMIFRRSRKILIYPSRTYSSTVTTRMSPNSAPTITQRSTLDTKVVLKSEDENRKSCGKIDDVQTVSDLCRVGSTSVRV
jgi:hypothetical protein